MKKLLLVCAAVLFFNNAQSQDVSDTITEEVCACASGKKETLQEADSEEIKMELGLCMISSVSKHKDEVTAEYGDVLEDEEAMEKLGSDIGLNMLSICPDVFTLFAGMDDDEDVDEVIFKEYSTIEGRIVEIKQEQFLTVVVKDNSGRSHTLLLLTFFEGSNLLTEGEVKKNDKVSIEYMEQEFYDVKAKDFRYYKVIQGIKKK
jgi:hypothetical protein